MWLEALCKCYIICLCLCRRDSALCKFTIDIDVDVEIQFRMMPQKNVSWRYVSASSGSGVGHGRHLWEFIRDLLQDTDDGDKLTGDIVRWENRAEGIFRIVDSKRVAQLWGIRKRNQTMTYEKLSRALRSVTDAVVQNNYLLIKTGSQSSNAIKFVFPDLVRSSTIWIFTTYICNPIHKYLVLNWTRKLCATNYPSADF